MKGNLTSPKTVVIELKDIWLNDIGVKAHTQFSNGEEIMDMYEAHPEFMDYRAGLIHSHNSMAVFFSSEDMDELWDNSPGVDMYFSLIVNNQDDYMAKIAMPSEDIITTTTVTSYKSMDKKKLRFREREKEELQSMIIMDLDIIVDRPETPDKWLDENINRVKALQEAKAAEAAKKSRASFNDARNFDFSKGIGEKISNYANKRLPKHISPHQLDMYTERPVGEDLGYSYEMEHIVARIISCSSGFNGSIKEALEIVGASWEDKEANDYIETVMQNLSFAYTSVTGSQMSSVMEYEVLNYIATVMPHGGLHVIKRLKGRVSLELINIE